MITAINSVSLKSKNYDCKPVKHAVNHTLNRDYSQTSPEAYRSYAMANTVAFTGKINGIRKTGAKLLTNFTQEFRLPQANSTKFNDFESVIKHYKQNMQKVVSEFNARRHLDGQFLKWVELPENQLKKNASGVSHLDEIVAQAKTLKSHLNPDGTERPLVVLGIGGSKHTAEFLANMSAVGNKGKVYFYSDIDPISFNNFIKETGKEIKGLNFLVVSKSGTTFETSDGFKRFENGLIKAYKKSGLSAKQAIAKAQEHFAICTDATPTAKNMRGKIGLKNGEQNNYIKELFVHDDVGGRYSMFDDHGLFVLSYAGVPQSNIQRILEGAAKASINSTTAEIERNAAAKSAIFNTFSRDNGFKLVQHQYYGHAFEGGGENWLKQLYLESLKDFDFVVGKAPDSMHYATEGHFSPANRSIYNTIMTIMNPKISKNYQTYTKAIAKTYNETTPLTIETLKVEGNAIKPEAIGEYVQSKHFETIYKGMLRRAVKNENTAKIDVMPEVIQPSVETYKNKFKMGEYQLNPGK